MKSIVGMSLFCLLMAATVPSFLQERLNSADEREFASTKQPKNNGPKIAQAYQDANGHFSFNAMLNGSHEEVLVDTGATIVAINWTTARRIGINLEEEDFNRKINTANGKARMASAIIDEVRIDGIIVRNVEAAVLSDDALSGTLLGMSFLNKLSRFEIEGSTLKLTQ